MSSSGSSRLHLVLGAGQIGPLVASMLLARGERVRIARRTSAPAGVDGVETVAIDVRDADSVARAADGASVVYHCVNPLYHEWDEKLLPMTRGILEGTARAGARLVALDNLYVYGDTSHMNERTPMRPVSKTGELRKRSTELMLEADSKDAPGVAVGRAADFFGPGAPLGVLGDHFHRRVLAGKSAQLFGDPDQLHSYSYTPDVAAGLVALGLDYAARGVWMLPVQPAESTRAYVARFAAALGRPIAIQAVPTWVLRGLGVFDPTMREVAEMTYQWKQPFVLDDSAFRARYGLEPTPWDEAIHRTVTWARETYEPALRKSA
jgi:nucleoside-diphosphate-sugar epimerase